MTKKLNSRISVITAALLLSVVSFLLVSHGRTAAGDAAASVPGVEVVSVEQKDLPVYREWIGTLDGMVNAAIRSQVTGYLLTQNFSEGSFVKKGQLLFEINPQPLQAAADQANGQLAQAQAQYQQSEAQLASAEANQRKAQFDENRYTPLAKQHAVTQQDLDNAVQNNISAQAQVKVAAAQVAAAKAQIQGAGAAVEVAPFELILADGSVHPQRGRFAFTGRQVNQGTGAIEVTGLSPNPGNILRPGQYGKVRVAVETLHDALLVPQQAVSELQGSYEVATVGQNDTVSIQPISVGDQIDGSWVVRAGLTAGDRVIVEGVQKVSPGMHVNPKLARLAARSGE